MMPRHEPVLAAELVSLLAPERGQVAVDCTFGAGGHARRVAELLGPEGRLIGIDRDPAAEARFARFAVEAPCRTLFIGADFAAGLRALRGEGIRPDMIYMDLGMSSLQVDSWERGFSYAYDAPLDMRMDTRQEFSAADLVNEWPQARIAQVLRRFGEERYASGIAREIVRRRPLATTSELVEAIKAGMPAAARFGGGHPAKRSFQAIRIAVNGELDSLEEALPLAWELLAVGGRLGVDLLPLARGPAGEAVPRREGARLRLPAGAAGLRLRPRARGRAADPARRLARARGGRGEPALALGPPAGRAQARPRPSRSGEPPDGRRRPQAPLRRRARARHRRGRRRRNAAQGRAAAARRARAQARRGASRRAPAPRHRRGRRSARAAARSRSGRRGARRDAPSRGWRSSSAAPPPPSATCPTPA